jgi:hypothetical protein
VFVCVCVCVCVCVARVTAHEHAGVCVLALTICTTGLITPSAALGLAHQQRDGLGRVAVRQLAQRVAAEGHGASAQLLCDQSRRLRATARCVGGAQGVQLALQRVGVVRRHARESARDGAEAGVVLGQVSSQLRVGESGQGCGLFRG